jgi:ABC-type uncharacterized transport system substrate-binding protein
MADTIRRLWRGACLAAVLGCGAAGPAAAHPHVLVTAKAEIVFDDAGRMTAVRNIWQFDPAFSAFASQGLDADGDGKLSDAELAPLAKINVDSLQEFDFFTYLTIDDKLQKFVPPKEYWLEPYNGQLTLFFTLPLKEPVKVGPSTTLEVFDEEYFVAFTFTDHDPIRLDNAPAGCSAAYHPPKELDDDIMAALAAIPADQRDLPPALADAAVGLANLISVTCR